MTTPRISASSYSNTAPLVWSFLYGSGHGKAELILDNAPARSAELLAGQRVDAALVPVIAYQTIEDVRLVPGVCIGSHKRVQSVCLVTRGAGLDGVRSVALDTSSRTSVALTKIVFREFLGHEPQWHAMEPAIDAMLDRADAALVIGDPALRLSVSEEYRTFDLAGLWHEHTGLGFIFAMWMTRHAAAPLDLAGARDEGLRHIPDIAANYHTQLGLTASALTSYLTDSIAYTTDDTLLAGMQMFFILCQRHALIPRARDPIFAAGAQ